jgi:hypothetical protein
MPSSSALIPMSICTLQYLFSHSFTTYEWLNRHFNVQIDIGIMSRWTGYMSGMKQKSWSNRQSVPRALSQFNWIGVYYSAAIIMIFVSCSNINGYFGNYTDCLILSMGVSYGSKSSKFCQTLGLSPEQSTLGISPVTHRSFHILQQKIHLRPAM